MFLVEFLHHRLVHEPGLGQVELHIVARVRVPEGRPFTPGSFTPSRLPNTATPHLQHGDSDNRSDRQFGKSPGVSGPSAVGGPAEFGSAAVSSVSQTLIQSTVEPFPNRRKYE